MNRNRGASTGIDRGGVVPGILRWHLATRVTEAFFGGCNRLGRLVVGALSRAGLTNVGRQGGKDCLH